MNTVKGIRIFSTVIAGAICLAAANPPGPSIEQVEADPNYTRVETRQIGGNCIKMPALVDLIKKNDGVESIHEVTCTHMIFTPPPSDSDVKNADAAKQTEAFAAFVHPKNGTGVFLKGAWANGDINITKISFDQETWHDVSKGRIRFYKDNLVNQMLIVVFAVYDDGQTQGIAFSMESDLK